MDNKVPESATNGWERWSNYVLQELKRLNSGLEGVNKELIAVRVEIATLKVKSGLWGMAGASIPILIGVIGLLIKMTMTGTP